MWIDPNQKRRQALERFEQKLEDAKKELFDELGYPPRFVEISRKIAANGHQILNKKEDDINAANLMFPSNISWALCHSYLSDTESEEAEAASIKAFNKMNAREIVEDLGITY